MRRILPLLLSLFLLSSCKAKLADTVATPMPAPVTPSPTAQPTPELSAPWWEELGADRLPQSGETVTLTDGTTVRCLGELAEPDVGLYSVLDARRNFPEFYLRHEAQISGTGRAAPLFDDAECALFWDDFDGSGGEELLFTLRDAQRSFLAVARWDDDWTYLPYDSYSAELEAALQYDYRSRTATVTYGRDVATYTLGAQEAGRIGLYTDFSDYSFFNLSGSHVSAVFGVGVAVNGEVYYFATVNADVDFDGANYTLRNIRLIPFGGV